MAIADNRITPKLMRIMQELKTLPQKAFQTFVDATPIAGGNARRKTKLVGSQIRADYDYATRLDQGYSKKRPEGMTKPTERFIKAEVKKIIRK